MYYPEDARFLGSPIDFIVFDGLDEGRLVKIVFIEVKTGSPTLNVRERQVKEAVEGFKVKWEEQRPQSNFKRVATSESGSKLVPPNFQY